MVDDTLSGGSTILSKNISTEDEELERWTIIFKKSSRGSNPLSYTIAPVVSGSTVGMFRRLYI